MREYKTILAEAELLALPPEVVAEFIKLRAEQTKNQ